MNLTFSNWTPFFYSVRQVVELSLSVAGLIQIHQILTFSDKGSLSQKGGAWAIGLCGRTGSLPAIRQSSAQPSVFRPSHWTEKSAYTAQKSTSFLRVYVVLRSLSHSYTIIDPVQLLLYRVCKSSVHPIKDKENIKLFFRAVAKRGERLAGGDFGVDGGHIPNMCTDAARHAKTVFFLCFRGQVHSFGSGHRQGGHRPDAGNWSMNRERLKESSGGFTCSLSCHMRERGKRERGMDRSESS